jgi:hypothetical protein
MFGEVGVEFRLAGEQHCCAVDFWWRKAEFRRTRRRLQGGHLIGQRTACRPAPLTLSFSRFLAGRALTDKLLVFPENEGCTRTKSVASFLNAVRLSKAVRIRRRWDARVAPVSSRGDAVSAPRRQRSRAPLFGSVTEKNVLHCISHCRAVGWAPFLDTVTSRRC